jgi:predicted MPP superfamily phosphohydrolase
MNIIHLSDLHLDTRTGIGSMRQRLALIRNDLQATALTPGPDNLILITGDLVDKARPDQFQVASEQLRLLDGYPLLLCPGNHD